MAKSKVITPANFGICDASGQELARRVPTVVGAKPTGSQILIEILTPQELSGATFLVDGKTDLKVPLQGYVRAVGPSVRPDEWGFKVGSRVLISGSGVMAPNYDHSHRDRFFMDPNSIKAVLDEGSDA